MGVGHAHRREATPPEDRLVPPHVEPRPLAPHRPSGRGDQWAGGGGERARGHWPDGAAARRHWPRGRRRGAGRAAAGWRRAGERRGRERVSMATTAHPYWPRSLPLPGYVASARPGWQSAGAVAASGAGLLALGWAVGGAKRSPARRLAQGWFLLCAGIHGVLEGWFSLRHRDLPAATGLLADVWKEYAKADSRYMTSDDFTVAMETVTAWAWGPLSFLTFLAFLRQHPARYVLQLLVSLGQLYGDVLYFATEARAGWSHSDPRPFYFWGYFVGLNGLWVLVPALLLADACRQLARAQRALDRPPHKAR